MKSKTVIFLILAICNSSLFAQDWADEEEEESSSGTFFVGVNVGAFFPDNNTAIIYTGSTSVTPYSINYILSNPYNKTTFDTYFKYPYEISELPQNPSYKTALDIGLHAGINIGGGNTIYIDLNSSTLNYEQSFTIEINDPNNQSVDPTYEQFPIIGKEKRFNLNLGTQLSLLNVDKTTIYWAFFGNFNSIKLEKNYIIINGREYPITHSSPQQPSVQPGGVGYGGGTGTGLKYRLTEKVLVDFTYNLYYIKTTMNDNIQGFGINHGLTFRLIWN